MLVLTALLLQPLADRSAEQKRCNKEVLRNGVRSLQYVGDRACVDFTPARRISGIWIDQFEGSAFYEGAQDLAALGARKDRIWLSFDDGSIIPFGFKRVGSGNAYRLTFVGRNARDMKRKPIEGYGHFGMSAGLVLVDRLVEWVDLGRLESGYESSR